MQEFTATVEGWVPKDEDEQKTLNLGKVNGDWLDHVALDRDLLFNESSSIRELGEYRKKVRVTFKLQVTVEEIPEEE